MDLIRKILREYDDEEEVSIFDKEMFLSIEMKL